MKNEISIDRSIGLMVVGCLLFGLVSVLSGCASSLPSTISPTSSNTPAASEAVQVSEPSKTPITPSPQASREVLTSTPYLEETKTPTPSATPSSTPSPTWVYVEAKQSVSVPMLMYHHVSDANPGARYSVMVSNFYDQMKFLQENGYTTVTTLELANVLWDGGMLPPRPIVITFDDGNEDLYENAYPILAELGFRAVVYIVGNTVDVEGYLGVDQLNQLLTAGWEIGSHSMTHANLADPLVDLNYEMYQSRFQLGKTLSTDVLTLAYPYTVAEAKIFQKVPAYGYRAAVCGGYLNEQSINNIYCLNRREVKGDMSMADFQQLLGLSSSTNQ